MRFFLILFIIFSANLMAEELDVDDLDMNFSDKARLDLRKKLDNNKSFEATFEQQILSSDGTKKQKYKIYVLSPNKFRLESVDKIKQQIISDGKYIWYIFYDIQQVIKKNIKKASISSMPILVFINKSFLNQFKVATDKNKNSETFFLFAKDQESILRYMEFFFINDNLKEIFITDNMNNVIKINFIIFKTINPNNSLFKVKMPKDFDLLEDQ